MFHSNFSQLVDDNFKVLPIVSKAIGGRTVIARAGFAQPIAEVELYGAENVVNGDCEAASAGWSAVGSPTSQARDSAQKHSGTYSWKLVTSGSGITGFGQTLNLTVGKLYKISFWYMQTSGVLCARLGSGTVSFQLLTDGNAGTFTNVVAYYIAESGNDFKLQFYDDSAATVYVDDISVKEVTSIPQKSLKVWLSTPSSNNGDIIISVTPNGSVFSGIAIPKGNNIELNIDMAVTRLFASGSANDVLHYLVGYVD